MSQYVIENQDGELWNGSSWITPTKSQDVYDVAIIGMGKVTQVIHSDLGDITTLFVMTVEEYFKEDAGKDILAAEAPDPIPEHLYGSEDYQYPNRH